MPQNIRILFIIALLTSTAANSIQAQEKKDPALACLFSGLVPGLGQYYNGSGPEVTKGVLQDVGVVGGLGLMEAEGINSLYGPTGLLGKQGGPSTATVLGFSLFAGSWAWSLIDAPISSDQINKEEVLRPNPSTLGLNSSLESGNEVIAGKKSPFLSGLLSAIVPGAGQYYNGTGSEITKGIIQEVGTFGLIFYGTSNPSYNNIVLVPPIIGCYLWSVIDAPITSADINGKVTAEMKPGVEPLKWAKSPDDAMARSILVPGLGQYYNGTSDEIVKGIIQEAVIVGGLAVAGASVFISPSPSSSNNSANTPFNPGRTVAGVSLALGAYLWSVIDAPLASDDINRKFQVSPAAGHIEMHLALLDDSASRMYPAAEMSFGF